MASWGSLLSPLLSTHSLTHTHTHTHTQLSSDHGKKTKTNTNTPFRVFRSIVVEHSSVCQRTASHSHTNSYDLTRVKEQEEPFVSAGHSCCCHSRCWSKNSECVTHLAACAAPHMTVSRPLCKCPRVMPRRCFALFFLHTLRTLGTKHSDAETQAKSENARMACCLSIRLKR